MEKESLFAFILGKNRDLSIAEVAAYLATRKVAFRVVFLGQDFAILSLPEEHIPQIDKLGGTIKIAKVSSILDNASISNLTIGKLFDTSLKKIKFGVSVYGPKANTAFQRELSNSLKDQLKALKITARYFQTRKGQPHTSHVEVIKQNLIEGGDVVICSTPEKYFVGKTVAVHNPFDFQKRDMKKPVTRAIFSIPPRLAKIMINFLGMQSGVILDPFCGVGCILQEVVMSGFEALGTDIDKKCIEASLKNIDWLQKEYNVVVEYPYKKIFVWDAKALASKFPKNSIGGIATEPYMGPPLKSQPDARQAKKIINELTMFYDKIFEQASIILKEGGRICIISPKFATKSGNFRIPIEKIAAKYQLNSRDPLRGMNIQHPLPYTDFEERHKLIREIHIFEKF